MFQNRQKKRISTVLLLAMAIFLPAMGHSIAKGATNCVDAGNGFCQHPEQRLLHASII
jgi:aspartate carbamoyltransferase catalytic subunit